MQAQNYTALNEKLVDTSVGIAGCGGLGSNIAWMLARSGIGKLVIADFDTVVMSNLSRQFFFVDDIGKNKVDALEQNLLKINSYIKLKSIILKLLPKTYLIFIMKHQLL